MYRFFSHRRDGLARIVLAIALISSGAGIGFTARNGSANAVSAPRMIVTQSSRLGDPMLSQRTSTQRFQSAPQR